MIFFSDVLHASAIRKKGHRIVKGVFSLDIQGEWDEHIRFSNFRILTLQARDSRINIDLQFYTAKQPTISIIGGNKDQCAEFYKAPSFHYPGIKQHQRLLAATHSPLPMVINKPAQFQACMFIGDNRKHLKCMAGCRSCGDANLYSMA